MHRILASLLLLLFLPIAAAPQTPAPPPSPESTQLRATAQRLLATGSPDDAAKAAELFDKASQIDARNTTSLKTDAERRKLEEPTGSGWMSFIIQLTPFFSMLIVAFTFVFTIYQAHRTAEQTRLADQQKREEFIRQQEADEKKRLIQQDADENKRLTDSIVLIQKTENFSPAAAILSTFMNGPRAATARQTGITLLESTKTFDNFRDLYNTLFEPATVEALPQILDLLRSVHGTVGPLLTKSWDGTTNVLSRLTPEETVSYNAFVPARTFLSVKVATVLRLPRDLATPLDLNDLGFDSCSLSGADIRNASIANGVWNMVNLDGADLRGVTDFQNAWILNSAWWHAAHIDAPFLQRLTQYCPYKDDQYSNSPQPISAQDYADNLTRLSAAANLSTAAK